MSQALTKRDDIELEPFPETSPYTHDEIRLGLTATAAFASTHAASEHIEAVTGKRIPSRTLSDWRKRYPMRYADLAERYRQTTEPMMKARLREVIIRGSEAQLDGIELTHEQIRDGTIKDASGAQRNLGVSVGIATQRLNELEGRPMVHAHVQVDAQDRLERLHELAPTIFPNAVDTTCEEIDADEDEGQENPCQEVNGEA